jgi:aminoglycoside phosphotransferase (APT) family kinase protein
MTRSAPKQKAAALLTWVEEALGAPVVHPPEKIASLWAGYGCILRYRSRDDEPRSCIVKQVRFPNAARSDASHARKVRSYEVELSFYQTFAPRSPVPRTAAFLGGRREAAEVWLLLEDLDAAGFSSRPRPGSRELVRGGLSWLAAFHGAHLESPPDGLWHEGSYWQLATRSAELRAIEGHPLHHLAPELDRRLRRAKYRTLIHGDPKVENFCVAPGPEPKVAAVDFQYVGGGVGARDLAYFLGSALPPERVEQELPGLVDLYFSELRAALELREKSAAFIDELEAEWRALVPVAWLDFYRFTLGWSPGWAKQDVYAERLLADLG